MKIEHRLGIVLIKSKYCNIQRKYNVYVCIQKIHMARMRYNMTNMEEYFCGISNCSNYNSTVTVLTGMHKKKIQITTVYKLHMQL